MFTVPRIKLQWAAAKTTPGEWRLGVFARYARPGGRGRGLAISLRGVLCWALAFAVLGYIGAAGVVWWKLESKPYNYVTYTDVLLYPIRRQAINELRGRALIEEAGDDLKAQKWESALLKLGTGLEKCPRDRNARLQLSQFFLAMKLRARAQETLLHGLDYGWPGRAYLESAINLALSGEDYDLAVDLCDRALALHDIARQDLHDRCWLIEQRVRALLMAERGDDVIAYIDTQKEVLSDEYYSELRLLGLLDAGHVPEAVTFAEAWRDRAGATSQVLRMLARTYREAGRAEDMMAALLELRTQSPADPRLRVFEIIQTLLVGREEVARLQIQDYLFRFSGTPQNLVLLAEPLGEINRLPEIELVCAAAAELGIKDPALKAAQLKVLVAQKNWAEAVRVINELGTAMAAGGANQVNSLAFLRLLVVAAADPAEGSQSSLVNYVRKLQLPMKTYRLTIDTLRAAGRPRTAKEIVVFAEGIFPQNRYLAEARAGIEQELRPARADKTSGAGKAQSPASTAFASSTVFFSTLDSTARDQGPEAALVFLRALRRAKTAWVSDQQEPIARAELGLLALCDDRVALQDAARGYINADRIRLRYVHDLASMLHDKNRLEEARLLLDETLKKIPGEPGAALLKARWFPAKPDAADTPSVN